MEAYLPLQQVDCLSPPDSPFSSSFRSPDPPRRRHPKFAGDLAAPPFPPEAIMDLLKKAATIVVYGHGPDPAGPPPLRPRLLSGQPSRSGLPQL